MKITVKVGDIKVTHSDTVAYGGNHSETIIKLLKALVEQALILKHK